MREAEYNRGLAKDERFLFEPAKGGDIRVVVAYPNRYWVAMSSLGFQTVFRLFAEQPRFAVERAFIPEKESISSGLRTFESGSRLSDADILAISLSYEMDYPHVLSLLEASGLDLDHCWETKTDRPKRIDSGFRPLIIGGGAALTLNPEPLANFFDALLIGEGEEAIPEIVNAYIEARNQKLPRSELLLRLCQLEGVYIPSLYQVGYDTEGAIRGFVANTGAPTRVKRRLLRKLDQAPTCTAIQTPNTEFSSMFMTETGRGCEQGCRFCVSGYMHRPVRKRSREVIEQSLPLGQTHGESVGFVGAAVSSHRAIAELTGSVTAKNRRASLSSLMTHRVTNELAQNLARGRTKSIALAPETGSEALRFRIGKRVSDEQIVQAIRTLCHSGITNLKLYFMFGLPTETIADVEEITRLTARLREEALDAKREAGHMSVAPKLLISLNAFIPKAWTPFQRHEFLGMDELKKRLKIIQQGVGKLPNVEIKYESLRESYFQVVLSRGDRRVGDLLLTMHQKAKDWRWLVRNGQTRVLESVPEPDYYVYRTFSEEEILPWEIVDLRIKRSLLEREYDRALNEECVR